MKLPGKLDIDALNAIGTEPEIKPTYVEPDSLEARLAEAQRKLWRSTMPEEAQIIRQVVETMRPYTLDLGTAKNHERVRMRLYRAKRQLLANNNQYVMRITFTTEGTKLTVKIAERLEKYRVPTPPDA